MKSDPSERKGPAMAAVRLPGSTGSHDFDKSDVHWGIPEMGARHIVCIGKGGASLGEAMLRRNAVVQVEEHLRTKAAKKRSYAAARQPASMVYLLPDSKQANSFKQHLKDCRNLMKFHLES